MVKITLTESQVAKLSRATSREVTLTLTQEQKDIISKSFGEKLKEGLQKASIIMLEGATEAAPFRPAGGVVSATITGISETKGAMGSVGG